METLSSILAWKIPWAEEPGGLQSMALQRVGHDRITEHTQQTSGKNREIVWMVRMGSVSS